MSYDIPSDPEEELPDWLKGIQSEEDRAEQEQEEFLPEEGADETPEWMDTKPLYSRESSDQSDEEEVPDWLSSIRETEGVLTPEVEDTPEPMSEGGDGLDGSDGPEGGDDPEWLVKLRDQQVQEKGDSEPAEEKDASGDLISRIQSLQKEEEDVAQGEDAVEAEKGDWVSGLGDTTAEEQELPWDLGVEEEGKKPPDWVEGTGSDRTGGSAEIPDWLNGVADDTSSSQPDFTAEPLEEEEAVASAAAAVEDEFPDLPGELGEVETPSWLANLQDSPDDSVAAGEVPAASDAPPSTSLDEGESFILDQADLPDWLDEISPSDYVIEEESIVEEPPVEEAPEIESEFEDSVEDDEEVDITPAELPSWLQAMRPVEGISSSAPRQGPRLSESESVGPLAGLDGVLPAEPGVVHFGTPSAPVTGLDISQTQQGYADLLQSMIASEEDTPPIQRRRVALPQQILRWAIAIILYGVVLIPILMGSQFVMLPSSGDIPPENLAVASLVNNLRQDDPVLVAFEYQPGLSGEMASASAAVIDHLLNQGTIPVIISTQPTGPGLAENFLQNTQSKHFLVTSGGYVNLGYISGGTAALLSFAADPRAAAPMTLEDGTSRWDQLPLTNIRSIRDFAMVFVLTDDSDTTRGWIEQVQPLLIDPNNVDIKTNLAMVVSAQAEPLIYPYYLTSPKQVDGLVSGMIGGAYYENTINQDVLARKYWDAFSAGLTITLLIVIFGGLFNLVRSFIASRRESGQRGKR